MKCPYCGAENNDSAKFCKECGKSIQKEFNYVCPKCGAPVEEKSKFCDNCGLDLAWVDADYDKIPIPVNHKQNKVKANATNGQRSIPQLVASIVTASLVFISLLLMFIGLFGDVFVFKMTGYPEQKMQFTYFFGDATKNFSSLGNGESAKLTKALISIHLAFYFIMFASIIVTFIALAIIIPFNFVKGKKVTVKPLLIPIIASIVFTGYTQIAFIIRQSSEGLYVGSGPILVSIGAMFGALATIASDFYNWPLNLKKILERSFFGGAMIFLIAACSFLIISPISLRINENPATITSPVYILQQACSELDSGHLTPAYYGSAILAFVFCLLAILIVGLSLYFMNIQKIVGMILPALAIPMIAIPSIIVAHDYAVATVTSGQTMYFNVSPYVIVFSVFIALYIGLLITSLILDKKAKQETVNA